GLCAVGHLVGSDACRDLGVACFFQVRLIEIANGLQHLLLPIRGITLWTCQVQDGIASTLERNALVSSGQETGAPIQRAPPRTAWPGLQHDKTRQILRFTTNAVSHPGTHAG